MKKPTYRETLINQGGLMRCCLGSLAEWVQAHIDEPAEPGTIVNCNYGCDDGMVLGPDLTWRWNH